MFWLVHKHAKCFRKAIAAWRTSSLLSHIIFWKEQSDFAYIILFFIQLIERKKMLTI